MTKDTAQLNTQESAEKQNTDNSPYFRRVIEDTPFTLVHNKENEYLITCGKYLITRKETEEDAINTISIPTWEVIGALIHIISREIHKELTQM